MWESGKKAFQFDEDAMTLAEEEDRPVLGVNASDCELKLTRLCAAWTGLNGPVDSQDFKGFA